MTLQLPFNFEPYSAALGLGVGLLLAWLITWLVLRARILLLDQQLQQQDEQHDQQAQLFQSLAAQALQQNQALFLNAAGEQFDKTKQAHGAALQSSVQSIAAMLDPMRRQVTDLSQQVQALEVKREGAYQQLVQNLLQQQQVQEQLRAETGELRRLMKHPAERGRWSDIQLQNIFRLSGMEQHVGDYTPQATSAGGTIRPDYVIHLPGAKHIVLDVKSPFDHYARAETSDDPAVIEAALRDHAGSIRTHIKELAKKDYGRAISGAPEFVIMFVHAEHLLTAALRADKELVQYGLQQRVVMATPTTLFALLSALAFGWQQANVTENARKIADLGKELYDSFAPFVQHWNNLGAALNKASEAFNSTVGSLQSKILPKARQMKALGVSVAEDLPEPKPVATEARLVHIPELVRHNTDEAAE